MFVLVSCFHLSAQSTFYVATTGSDATGTGSSANPWATITHALDQVADGSLILVKPGIYTGRIRMRGTFAMGVSVRSEVPYQAQLRNNDRVLTFYTAAQGCEGITLEGFDIAHTGAGSAALVVHIDGGGNASVSRITIKNNILHDSYNNDILKINNACRDIIVEGNMFYNQFGSDEHIDANSIENLVIQDNIFFNDYAGSGRTNPQNTSSFIIVKDSNGSSDIYTGSKQITIRRNVFLHYEGSTGHGFVGIGEDGQPFYEAEDVMIENNLMLGDGNRRHAGSLSGKGLPQYHISAQHPFRRLPCTCIWHAHPTGRRQPHQRSGTFLSQHLVRPNRYHGLDRRRKQ